MATWSSPTLRSTVSDSTLWLAAAYQPIVDSGRAAVIAGFEPADILGAILLILEQLEK